jgi:hypothetical protein
MDRAAYVASILGMGRGIYLANIIDVVSVYLASMRGTDR